MTFLGDVYHLQVYTKCSALSMYSLSKGPNSHGQCIVVVMNIPFHLSGEAQG